jgi:transcriptional regulator with XRE-family HTH domain
MTVHLASDTVGANVRMMRKNRGLSVAELAEKCADLGSPQITAAVIENIEHGRRKNGDRTRDVTVDELIILADALMVGPGLLLPEMISQYEYGDDTDRDLVLDTIVGNLEVMKQYVEQKRVTASLVVTPVFGANLSGEGKLSASDGKIKPGADLSGSGTLDAG